VKKKPVAKRALVKKKAPLVKTSKFLPNRMKRRRKRKTKPRKRKTIKKLPKKALK